MLQTIVMRREWLSRVGLIALVLLAVAITLLPTQTTLLLIGGGFLCLALLRFPELAVYFLILAVPFGSLMPLPVAGANVTAADGLLLLALVLWLARQIARRQIVLRRASLLLPFLVFILAISLSLTVALSLQASAKELLKWIEMLAIYWLVVQEFGPQQMVVHQNETLARRVGAAETPGRAAGLLGAERQVFSAQNRVTSPHLHRPEP